MSCSCGQFLGLVHRELFSGLSLCLEDDYFFLALTSFRSEVCYRCKTALQYICSDSAAAYRFSAVNFILCVGLL